MTIRDLEPELLRAFVAVVEGGGFSRAAGRLHLSQSTISQRIKRLEERLGTGLLSRTTRGVALTERGELLLGYARRLLALNDEALAALEETRLAGGVRLGAAQEVADGGLTDLLGHFSRLHPGVRLEIRVDANRRLRDAVNEGALDLALLFQEPGEGGEVTGRARRVWAASRDWQPPTGEPLPLVLFDAPCLFRNAALEALERAGQPWRVALSTPSLSGIRAAVRAGLGVSVRTERWLEPDMRIVQELPPLPEVELALIRGTNEGGAAERLRAALREALITDGTP